MFLKGYKGHFSTISSVTPVPIPTAPTASLLPLHRLLSTSTEQICAALSNLRSLYFPPPPPPLPKKITIPKRNLPRHLTHGSSSVPDSGYASADDEVEAWTQPDQNCDADSGLELLRADPFERAFAIKWVTGFITRSDMWVELAEGDDEGEDGGEATARAKLVEEATAILSLFSTDEEEEEFAVTRTFTFPLSSDADSKGIEEQRVIKVELNDAPLLLQDHTSVGLQSWASSIILSERIAASPSLFSLLPSSSTSYHRKLRILELGAGTGLLSIVAAKISAEIESKPIIVATDYHPDVLENLKKNVHTNFPSSDSSKAYPIDVESFDWEHPRYDAPFDERFDVILAADVVYHPDHARWIKNCVQGLLMNGGVFWMMVAVRNTGRHEGLHTTVDDLFPSADVHPVGDEPVLVISKKEEVGKQGGVGRVDEGGYELFNIKWNSST
ncbi:hypothetical protein AN958_10947 [Leucoagaricus sp. SymC.cos]|nr:hypothetical protein AN958_10947 [Leucoagaricus sp. SymC.cos]